MIEGTCEDLAVCLYPAGGFSSITFAFEAAQFLQAEIDDTGKKAVVFYIGDYDPAGVLIDQSLEAELRRHLGCGEEIPDWVLESLKHHVSEPIPDPVDLCFHQLAITSDQIRAHDLPTKPRKGSDRRALHVEHAVEAEAMPAATLRRLLRDAIEAHLPEDALAVAKAAEASDREHLTRWARLMQNGPPP